jgi:hypothetical protein
MLLETLLHQQGWRPIAVYGRTLYVKPGHGIRLHTLPQALLGQANEEYLRARGWVTSLSGWQHEAASRPLFDVQNACHVQQGWDCAAQ